MAVLVTCFNRRAVTIRGLTSLLVALEEVADVTVDVYLVDDNSCDGTAQAVRERFPRIHVISGTGDLYWAGGMALAFREAFSADQDHDTYLLFNDDVIVSPTALPAFMQEFRSLNQERKSILIGALTSGDGSVVTYAGFCRLSRNRPMSYRQVFSPDVCAPADTFNGNFVLFPASTLESLGGPDARYRHTHADLDLGLRASRTGVNVLVHGRVVGTCDRGESPGARLAHASHAERWRFYFVGVTGMMPYYYFVWEHGRKLWFPGYIARSVAMRFGAWLGYPKGFHRSRSRKS